MTADAYSGIMGRAHRVSGKGGLEDTEMRVDETLGESIWCTSLIEWLKDMRLHIETCGRGKEPEMAVGRGSSRMERIEMNRRGIVTKGEGDEGADGCELELRLGQIWKEKGKLIEIFGFNGDRCETMKWSGKIREGQRVRVKKGERY